MSDLRPDPDELSKRELTIGYWIAAHRRFLHWLSIAWWALVAVVPLALFVRTTLEWNTHRKQTDEIWRHFPLNVINVQVYAAPVDIVLKESAVVGREEGVVDLFFLLNNNNDQWAATAVPVTVMVGGTSVGTEMLSFAPQETKAIVKTQIPFAGTALPSARLDIDTPHIQWKHMSTKDPSLPLVSFESSNARIESIASPQAHNPFHSSLTLMLRNKSVFGFREAHVVVLLRESSGKVAAIGSTYLVRIDSLESKELTFRWPVRLSHTLTPEVIVNVDRLDASRIIK